jgi:hypothetical protein
MPPAETNNPQTGNRNDQTNPISAFDEIACVKVRPAGVRLRKGGNDERVGFGEQGSPSCGVTQTWLDERQQEGVGVFIRLLRERLAQESLAVEIFGVTDHEQQEGIDWLTRRI